MPIGKFERTLGIYARRNSNNIRWRRIQSEERKGNLINFQFTKKKKLDLGKKNIKICNCCLEINIRVVYPALN